MKRVVALVVIAAACAAAIVPITAGATPADHSCVDVANDGVCGPGDPALAPLLASGTFNAAGLPLSTGVIFDGYTMPHGANITVHAGGNVKFENQVQSQGSGGSLTVTSDGTITVADKTKIRMGGSLTLQAPTIHVGFRAAIMASNTGNKLTLHGTNIVTGPQSVFEAPGHDGGLDFVADNAVAFGAKTSFHTDQRAHLDITTHSNIVATELHILAGDLEINALGRPGQARTITLTNSVVNSTYPNGRITMYAGPGGAGAHTTGDAISFRGGSIKPHTKGNASYDPPPTFTRTGRR